MKYILHKPKNTIKGTIYLTSSKSISNRALIIQALTKEKFNINNLAEAQDTKILQELLNSIKKSESTNNLSLNVGDAGTTMRFLTAFLASREGNYTLTGSERMKQRPIKILVDVLIKLGAQIEYIENPGYPPIHIKGTNNLSNFVEIDGNVSSQYITAMLLIAPTLPNGLNITIKGKILSQPYIEMTLNMMHYFGIEFKLSNNIIKIPKQNYIAKDFTVESDWSSASYWYEIAALSDNIDINITGLNDKSLQGDSILSKIYESFGVNTIYTNNGITLSKKNTSLPDFFKYNFINCPDLAQTLAVTCAALNINAELHGLDNLSIKETDRIQALYNEFQKLGISCQIPNPSTFTINKGNSPINDNIIIETYNDHRMAMAFAPLSLKTNNLKINNPLIVVKSYPNFWNNLVSTGFDIEEIND